MSVHKVPVIVCTLLACILGGCHPRSYDIEPSLDYTPHRLHLSRLPFPFAPLEEQEKGSDWGKEYRVGCSFAKELDLYRAITSLKRALYLLPPEKPQRRWEIEFFIVQSYFLGKKYALAIETFETSTLSKAPSSFPAFRELLIILYVSYKEVERDEQAEAVFSLIKKGDPELKIELEIFDAFNEGDLQALSIASSNHPHQHDYQQFIQNFHLQKKSVRHAQTLNALLPGAGYFYVGQKKTALTSLIINTSFIAAAYHFFSRGNWGAGAFTTSLEFGWYFGGINGAGLAAKQYNEHLYNTCAKEVMVRRNVFPIMLLGTGF